MCKINFDIAGRVAVITGAGGVICGTMARELARKGVKVALLDLTAENAEKIVEEINADGGNAIAVQADVLDRASLETARKQVLAHFGGIDILINGADPATTPVMTFDNGTATVNTETCEALGLDFTTIESAFSPLCTKVATITTAESFGDLEQ